MSLDSLYLGVAEQLGPTWRNNPTFLWLTESGAHSSVHASGPPKQGSRLVRGLLSDIGYNEALAPQVVELGTAHPEFGTALTHLRHYCRDLFLWLAELYTGEQLPTWRSEGATLAD